MDHGGDDWSEHLLLLLLFVFGAGVDSRKHGTGLDDDAGSRFLGRLSIRRTHGDCNAQFAMSLALVHAAGGWDIPVVAANRYPNMAICTHQVVGGVECDPA